MLFHLLWIVGRNVKVRGEREIDNGIYGRLASYKELLFVRLSLLSV